MLVAAVSMVCAWCHAAAVGAELVLGTTSSAGLLTDDYLSQATPCGESSCRKCPLQERTAMTNRSKLLGKHVESVRIHRLPRSSSRANHDMVCVVATLNSGCHVHCTFTNARRGRVVSSQPIPAEWTRYAMRHPTCHILAGARYQSPKSCEASRARMQEGPQCRLNSARRFSELVASAWAK